MNTQHLERQFARIGARAKVHPPVVNRWTRAAPDVLIDIGNDAHGEFFDVAVKPAVLDDAQVIDVRPAARHLLLMTRQNDGKHKFLCGHDERHWFVAAVPELANVASVRGAFDALKPPAVHCLERQLGVKPSKQNRRRNEAFIRQGEWFFVPVENQALVDVRWILRNEPIARSGGKPHMCEELVRQGGEVVYISSGHPDALTEAAYEALMMRRPQLRSQRWITRRRNARVFVRGCVRHPDHKTICFHEWREVIMNTENEAAAMRHVAFID